VRHQAPDPILVGSHPGGALEQARKMGRARLRYSGERGQGQLLRQRQSTHDLSREILPGMLGRYQVTGFLFFEGIDKAPAC
jgi:hypothetical protein